MISIGNMYKYPLTGANGQQLGSMEILKGGPESSRQLVCYAPDINGINRRLSTKPDDTPSIGSLEINATSFPDELVVWRTCDDRAKGFMDDVGVNVSEVKSTPIIKVVEFGLDEVPCNDLGDDVASLLFRHTGREGIRMARKTDSWMNGEHTLPRERKNAPLHLVSYSSAAALRDKIGSNQGLKQFVAHRFRPDIVVLGGDPFEENFYKSLQIKAISGDKVVPIEFEVLRPTSRCKYPGSVEYGDPEKDTFSLSTLRDSLKELCGQTTFGVYLSPILPECIDRATISARYKISVL